MRREREPVADWNFNKLNAVARDWETWQRFNVEIPNMGMRWFSLIVSCMHSSGSKDRGFCKPVINPLTGLTSDTSPSILICDMKWMLQALFLFCCFYLFFPMQSNLAFGSHHCWESRVMLKPTYIFTVQTADEGGGVSRLGNSWPWRRMERTLSPSLCYLRWGCDRRYLSSVSVPLSSEVKAQPFTTYSAAFCMCVCLPLSVLMLASDNLHVKSWHICRQLGTEETDLVPIITQSSSLHSVPAS